MNKQSTLIVVLLLIVGFAMAGYFAYDRIFNDPLDGLYTVTDGFVDSVGIEQASVSFVRIDQYDSLMCLRIAERLTRTAIEQSVLDKDFTRQFLYHFFEEGDTSALSADMVEDLQYSHPSKTRAEQKLVAVPNGWIVSATFAPKMFQPKKIRAMQQLFYMPKQGYTARDLR